MNGPEAGDAGFQRRQRAVLRSFARGVSGGVDPAVDLVEPSGVHAKPRPREAQIRVVDNSFRGQPVDPTGNRLLASGLQELVPLGGDQLDGVAEVAGRGRMSDRFGDRVGRSIPSRRAAVKLEH